jgi:hypothetical protein
MSRSVSLSLIVSLLIINLLSFAQAYFHFKKAFFGKKNFERDDGIALFFCLGFQFCASSRLFNRSFRSCMGSWLL